MTKTFTRRRFPSVENNRFECRISPRVANGRQQENMFVRPHSNNLTWRLNGFAEKQNTIVSDENSAATCGCKIEHGNHHWKPTGKNSPFKPTVQNLLGRHGQGPKPVEFHGKPLLKYSPYMFNGNMMKNGIPNMILLEMAVNSKASM